MAFIGRFRAVHLLFNCGYDLPNTGVILLPFYPPYSNSGIHALPFIPAVLGLLDYCPLPIVLTICFPRVLLIAPPLCPYMPYSILTYRVLPRMCYNVILLTQYSYCAYLQYGFLR